MSEARTDDRLEADMREVKTTLAGLVPILSRIDERLNATLPHLATKVELAALDNKLSRELSAVREAVTDKPGRGYLWAVMAALFAAQAVALTAAGVILTLVQRAHAPAPAPSHASAAGIVLAADTQLSPYSCRLLYDEQKKCAFESCDRRVVERLRNECLRDGGRP
jgi:hypothetical protein